MRHLLRRMGPGLVGASAMQLNQVVDVIVGSLLPPGAISLLYYADRVNQLPLGTIGAAVGTALLPLLSRQVRGPDPAAPVATLNRALEFALALTVPAALALIVGGYPILVVLFERGAFTPGLGPARVPVAGGLRARAAVLRAGQGAGTRLLRPRRHVHAGADRHAHAGAELRAQPGAVHPAAACRPGAGDQPGRRVQRRPGWRSCCGGAASCAPMRAAASGGCRASAGCGGHGGDAVAGAARWRRPGVQAWPLAALARVAPDWRLAGPAAAASCNTAAGAGRLSGAFGTGGRPGARSPCRGGARPAMPPAT